MLRLPLGVFRDVYTSATSWEQLHSDCRDCISRGGSLIIFPERLLTPREGTNPYRRTAARLSRECACDIQPLYIGGSDKYGLGTPTAPLAYCRTGIYLYELKLLPLIEGAGYTQLKDREASVAVTKKIHDEISAEAYLSDYRIV
jgi:1-acyl-sn-glycerol-3-phosphate acyltransferase